MQTAIRLTATVQTGGKVEVADAQLPMGQAVDVIVLFPKEAGTSLRSVVDVLAEAPGHLEFQDAAAVDSYVSEERDAWER